MPRKETILQKTARLTGYDYNYVRQVNCGNANNETISKMILTLKREELDTLTKSIKHQAVNDFKKRKK